jgi:hypothetical protein
MREIDKQRPGQRPEFVGGVLQKSADDSSFGHNQQQLLTVDNEHLVHIRQTSATQTFYLIAPDLTPWKEFVEGTGQTVTGTSNLRGVPLGLTLKNAENVAHVFSIDNGGIISLTY